MSQQIKKLVPKLRFKGFEGEWEKDLISNVSTIVWWWTPDTSVSDYWWWEIQRFTPTEIKNKFINNSLRTITKLWLKKSSAKILPPWTILFTSRATIAEVSISNIECSTNQWFQSMIVNDKNINLFLYYWILNNKKIFIRKSSWSTFLEISKHEIKKIKIVKPKINEQQKIASFLTAVDTKIQQLESLKSVREQYKKGVMQKIFSQEIRFKDEKGEEFGEWKEKKLKDITDTVDYRWRAPTKTESWVFLVTAKNIRKWYIDYQASKEYVSKEELPEIMRRWYPEKWDVLFTTEAPLWNVAVVDNENIALAQRVIKFRWNEKLNSWFLFYLMMSYQFQKDIFRKAFWSTVLWIQWKILHNHKVSIPTYAEQLGLVEFLDQLTLKTKDIDSKIEQAKQRKKWLLQQMFV